MNKIKLLWIGDSPTVTTGFGRVSQGVLEGLYNTNKYDIVVLGINQETGDPHRYEGMFRIYPARSKGNIYGFNRVEEVIEKENPHIIVINNDLWIAAEYVKPIPENNKIFIYSPVDALPVNRQWLNTLKSVNARIGTYTDFAKDGILAADPKLNLDVIGHGVDTDEFYPMSDARRFISNIPDDLFIIQNVNRNQPRKRLDLFIQAMKLWLDRLPGRDRSNVAFYYHGSIKDVGWNLLDLAKRWGVDDRFFVSDQRQISPSMGLPLAGLNKVYNVADIHVMTSMGEGFGLSPLESAACRVAQVVPDHSACKEIWTGNAELIKIDRHEVFTGGINTEGGVISIEHLADILDDLYHNRDKVKNLADLAYDHVHQEQYTWDYVSKRFDQVLMSMYTSDKFLSTRWQDDEVKRERVECEEE